MRVEIRPLDQIAKRWGTALLALSDGQARKAMARAMTAEGRPTFAAVKKALRTQTSIPTGIIRAGTSFKGAGASDLTTIITGTGRPLSLKLFKPRQFSYGVRATVWGRAQKYPGMFMGPRPGVLAPKLGGHPFVRESKSRLPIDRGYGPSIPVEIVKDASRAAFEASPPRIVERIGREIAKVLAGY
ncbi:MAG: hypothetical protein U1E62_21640 [Alsobacter sp.]